MAHSTSQAKTYPPSKEEQDKNNSNNNNDFVIRDGFPALRLPNGQPWINAPEPPIPPGPFWACENALFIHGAQTLQQLRMDCETVFSARTKAQDQPYSLGVTYFLPCHMKPRCALEALVGSIFQKHTAKLPPGAFLPEQSGAEWWTLVLDEDEDKPAPGKVGNTDDEEGEDESDEVGMHFDADYGLEDQVPNLLLHPRCGTVTYLSDCGAPTVVLNQRSPPPNDTEKKTLQGDVDKGWLSHPKIGKHIAFDGRLLHGAPATFFPGRTKLDKTADTTGESKEPPSKKLKRPEERSPSRRYTLLVNIWLNHCPLDAELLEDELIDKLGTPWQANDDGDKNDAKVGYSWNESFSPAGKESDPCKRVSLSVSKTDPAGEEEVVMCNHLVTVKYGATMEELHDASNLGSLVELSFGKGALTLEVGDGVQSDEDGEG